MGMQIAIASDAIHVVVGNVGAEYHACMQSGASATGGCFVRGAV